MIPNRPRLWLGRASSLAAFMALSGPASAQGATARVVVELFQSPDIWMGALGRWIGKVARYDLPSSPDNARAAAIIVQTGKASPILAATKG